MVYLVIVIVKKHVRLVYAKMWNIKLLWWICNEFAQLRGPINMQRNVSTAHGYQ